MIYFLNIRLTAVLSLLISEALTLFQLYLPYIIVLRRSVNNNISAN